MRFIILLFLLITGIASENHAQNLLINGDLETEREEWGVTYIPAPWEHIPHTFPFCIAESVATASPDLTSRSAPKPEWGIAGRPFSGNTFICGGLSGIRSSGLTVWHEGIQQEIIGLEIDSLYNIGFYQTVVKVFNAINNISVTDPSGSWAIYLDMDLVGISKPSYSSREFDNLDLDWDFRALNFVATDTSHILRFLPHDDDEDYFSDLSSKEGLSMGIDNISVTKKRTQKPSNNCLNLYPNPSFGDFVLDLDKEYKNVQLEIYDVFGRIVQQHSYQDIHWIFLNTQLPSGSYYIHIQNSEGIDCLKPFIIRG